MGMIRSKNQSITSRVMISDALCVGRLLHASVVAVGVEVSRWELLTDLPSDATRAVHPWDCWLILRLLAQLLLLHVCQDLDRVAPRKPCGPTRVGRRRAKVITEALQSLWRETCGVLSTQHKNFVFV